MKFGRSPLVFALMVTGIVSQHDAHAVRVNPDGQGQALIYPYYTARLSTNNIPFVTAASVTNTSSKPKALKVRFLEGKAGATVLDFNLFLGAYDVWTSGIVAAGAGAGIFTADHSCTSPGISSDSTNPTRFRNGAYQGHLQNDGLDRTYDGYFEILEMGAIEAGELANAVTAPADYSAVNASRPTCQGLPTTDLIPATLSKPTGGLAGSVSYLNVLEGIAFTVDAVALSQWSNKAQWGGERSEHPNLADVSPATSYVVSATEGGDTAYLSTWSSGRDAITALLMVDAVRNEYTVESGLKAKTDWVLAMPTKRFYVSAVRRDPPFGNVPSDSLYICERPAPTVSFCVNGYFDRETTTPGACIDFAGPYDLPDANLCGVASVQTFSANGGSANLSHVFQSVTLRNVPLGATWQNGWYDFPTAIVDSARARISPGVGATTVIDLATGQITSGATVTYFGLPIVGFGVQAFANGSLPGANGPVLSNYGGQSSHKFTRRIHVAP